MKPNPCIAWLLCTLLAGCGLKPADQPGTSRKESPAEATPVVAEPPIPERAPGSFHSQSYSAALKTAEQNGRDLLVLVRGSDWCRPGEKFKAEVWDRTEFTDALGDGFVLFDADVMERPTEDQARTLASRSKGFDTNFGNYPVLVLVDSVGARYATFSGQTFPRDLESARDALTDARRAREIRDHHLAQAERTTAVDRADRLFDAARAQAGMQEQILKLLADADPEDTTGYRFQISFKGEKILVEARDLANEEKFEEAVALLDERLGKPGLTLEQKQWILVSKGHVYQRWPEHDAQAIDLFTEVAEINPTNTVGRAATRIVGKFLGPPSVEYGWDARHCSTGSASWHIDARDSMTGTGDYEIEFVYQRGRSALTVESVLLFDAGVEVARDEHVGVAGHNPQGTVYRLRLEQPPKQPVLRVTSSTGPDTNSAGEIRVRRVTL